MAAHRHSTDTLHLYVGPDRVLDSERLRGLTVPEKRLTINVSQRNDTGSWSMGGVTIRDRETLEALYKLIGKFLEDK